MNQEEQRGILENLQLDTAARCLFLFSPEGYLINHSGYVEDLDIEAIGALVSGEFAAAESLALLIGNELAFTSNYHEGTEHSMYVHGIKDKGLLVMIFDASSNLGIVRYYAAKTVAVLEQMLSTGILPPIDKFADPDHLDQYIDDNINLLFSSMEGEKTNE